jgi:rubrerythrin
MSFNPLEEKGMPIEKQIRSWTKQNSKPYHPGKVHPYTRVRGIFMNGIEVEAALFSHNFHRHTEDMELLRQLALFRRVEQKQQKAINWLIPGNESVLAVTLGYEQVAVDLTAALAKNEPDPYVKAALDFALLEDFDHLYRYANLQDMIDGVKPETITGKYTEIMPGRPTIYHHRHPFDTVRNYYDSKKASPLTKLHALTITAAEQQTMNFYMNVGNRLEDPLARALYLEIAEVEEQHVTHYGSLMDPRCSWFEMLALHEYTECWLYHSLVGQEPDKEAKRVWEEHLDMELEHLKMACDMMRKYEKRDPEEVLPQALPDKPLIFESNIDYVRDILKSQVDFNAYRTDFMATEKLPDDKLFKTYQKQVNTGVVPSDEIIKAHVQKDGEDYRQEIKGRHPVKWLQGRDGKSKAA